MLTEKDYCDYETCIALKELGYKVPTSAYYMPKNSQLIFVINQFRGGSAMDCFYSHNSLPKECMASDFIDAPTIWEAQKWLREEKGIHIEIPIRLTNDSVWKYNFGLRTREVYDRGIGEWSSYEEALSEGLRASIKILQDEQKENN